MAWKKADKPRYNVITARINDDELAAVNELMKREKISKNEAIRRLAFPAGEA